MLGKKGTILQCSCIGIYAILAYLDEQDCAFRTFKVLSCNEPYLLGHYEIIVLKKQPFFVASELPRG